MENKVSASYELGSFKETQCGEVIFVPYPSVVSEIKSIKVQDKLWMVKGVAIGRDPIKRFDR